MIRYGVGQRYNKHTDAYDPTNARGINACRDGGNRMVTALIYLTEVAEGGETGFINMRLDIPPVPGTILIFHNCYEGSCSLHPDSLHAGKPVITGEKWACNLWFRERPTAAGAAALRRAQAGKEVDGADLSSWDAAEKAEVARINGEVADNGTVNS